VHHEPFLVFLFQLNNLGYVFTAALLTLAVPYFWNSLIKFKKIEELIKGEPASMRVPLMFAGVFIPIAFIVAAIKVVGVYTNSLVFPMYYSSIPREYLTIYLPLLVVALIVFFVVKKLDRTCSAPKKSILLSCIGYCVVLYFIQSVVYLTTVIILSIIPSGIAFSTNGVTKLIPAYTAFFAHLFLASILITQQLKIRLIVGLVYIFIQLIYIYIFNVYPLFYVAGA
jgi:hypothetical protein